MFIEKNFKVGHWDTVAGFRYQDEMQARDRLVSLIYNKPNCINY